MQKHQWLKADSTTAGVFLSAGIVTLLFFRDYKAKRINIAYQIISCGKIDIGYQNMVK